MPDASKRREHIHTLIVSDTHIGSPLCKSAAIVTLLDSFTCEQVIYNGDIFDSEDLRQVAKRRPRDMSKTEEAVKGPRLKRSHHHVLAHMSGLSKRSERSVYLRGNHDEGLAEIIAFFTGTTVEREHRWEYQGKKFIAIHGDQFDEFTLKYKWVSGIATDLYWWIQALLSFIGLGWFADRFCRLIKRAAKHSTRAFERVERGAMGYAELNDFDHIICGHTHMADYAVNGQGIHYYNGGCCTELPISCITIEESGMYLRKFNDHGQISKDHLSW